MLPNQLITPCNYLLKLDCISAATSSVTQLSGDALVLAIKRQLIACLDELIKMIMQMDLRKFHFTPDSHLSINIV